jgi:hypothetical protein
LAAARRPTWAAPDAGWRGFQQFMIGDRAEGPVREIAFATPARARLAPAGAPPVDNPASAPLDPDPRSQSPGLKPTPEILAALGAARAVIVGPSNPVISIWPILHALGNALAEVTVPVVCVSPIVGGEVVKGPTAAFLAAYEQPASTAGVVAFYESIAPGLLDGVVADEHVDGPATLEIDTNMPDAPGRARVAEQTLAFAETLSG